MKVNDLVKKAGVTTNRVAIRENSGIILETDFGSLAKMEKLLNRTVNSFRLVNDTMVIFIKSAV
ncbi:hypothetical protein D3C81_06960 [compost metagenome]